MATLQANLAKSGIMPRQIHAGLQMQYATYTTASGTLSVGDIIQMMKLPDSARIIDGFLKYSAFAGSTVAQINLGTRASNTGLIASATGNAAQAVNFDAAGTLRGALQDISDAATTRYTMIECLIGGTSLTGTGTISIECCVTYQID